MLEPSADPTDALIDLAIESWRLSRQYLRAIEVKEASTAQRQSGQVRYFQKRLDDILSRHCLRVICFDGQAYEIGMAVTALNAGDFGPEDNLVVEQTLEPTILDGKGIRRIGTAMLGKR